jgi:hypothetical protein
MWGFAVSTEGIVIPPGPNSSLISNPPVGYSAGNYKFMNYRNPPEKRLFCLELPAQGKGVQLNFKKDINIS